MGQTEDDRDHILCVDRCFGNSEVEPADGERFRAGDNSLRNAGHEDNQKNEADQGFGNVGSAVRARKRNDEAALCRERTQNRGPNPSPMYQRRFLSFAARNIAAGSKGTTLTSKTMPTVQCENSRTKKERTSVPKAGTLSGRGLHLLDLGGRQLPEVRVDFFR